MFNYYCKCCPKQHNLLRWLLRRGSPLPIPNREVKPDCADGTAICGRVCRRLFFEKPIRIGWAFLFLVLFEFIWNRYSLSVNWYSSIVVWFSCDGSQFSSDVSWYSFDVYQYAFNVYQYSLNILWYSCDGNQYSLSVSRFSYDVIRFSSNEVLFIQILKGFLLETLFNFVVIFFLDGWILYHLPVYTLDLMRRKLILYSFLLYKLNLLSQFRGYRVFYLGQL